MGYHPTDCDEETSSKMAKPSRIVLISFTEDIHTLYFRKRFKNSGYPLKRCKKSIGNWQMDHMDIEYLKSETKMKENQRKKKASQDTKTYFVVLFILHIL